jgi:uncharacterized protein YbaR (Trm112 family)
MPANLVRCASCRALLNPDLSPREILAPEFVPLQEVEAVIDTPIIGYFVTCPKCQKELRIHSRYDGQHVACKFCNGQFPFKLQPLSVQVPAFYADCPHCKKELRAARKYSDAKVECKFCNGSIHFV